jgi:hypothetical protein
MENKDLYFVFEGDVYLLYIYKKIIHPILVHFYMFYSQCITDLCEIFFEPTFYNNLQDKLALYSYAILCIMTFRELIIVRKIAVKFAFLEFLNL